MRTLAEFVTRIAPVLYALSIIGVFFSIRGLVQARRARRIAVFGLEREAAKRTQRRSLSTIFILSLLAGMVYIIQNIIVPNMGEPVSSPTPTPIVFVTPEATATEVLLLYPTITPTPGLAPAEETAAAPDDTAGISGCEISGARITKPTPNDTVSGQVLVEGEANILNFAQYKFEINGPATNGVWVVVGTFVTPIPAGVLGTWDSTSLLPGNYLLRLVVLRVDGTFPTPCEVPIVILEQ